jgi:LPS O-antigen subunit length determinant protein (WzzB/FepE family)
MTFENFREYWLQKKNIVSAAGGKNLLIANCCSQFEHPKWLSTCVVEAIAVSSWKKQQNKSTFFIRPDVPLRILSFSPICHFAVVLPFYDLIIG